MVFESIVADILNRFLGTYIENLDSNQLKIGIWGGDVVLTNLILRQTALKDLDLPVQNVFGRLDKLVLKIPWKNLYTESVIVNIKGLYLLLKPNKEVKYDPIKEEKREFQDKQATLSKIEKMKKAQKVDPNKKNANDSFTEKLVTQIIKNVQLRISKIHVRYEESNPSLGEPYSFGVSLANLNIQTTDFNWVPMVVKESVQKIFKIVLLEGLAVYWNSGTELFCNLSSNEEISSAFIRDIATKDTKPSNYYYVFGPINSEARLKLNTKPESDPVPYSEPKAIAELVIPKFVIAINKSQYQDIMSFVDSMSFQTRGMPYRKYRPLLPSYKGYYKNWWQFAYTCILETEIRRRRRDWDWNHMIQHLNTCRSYKEHYKNKLLSKKPAQELLNGLQQCEKSLDLFNLVLIREQVELEVEKLDRSRESTAAKGWFSGWFGGSKKESSEENTILDQFQNVMTPEEKQKLYSAIDYNESTGPIQYPETYVDTKISFVLNSFDLIISDDTNNHINVLSSKLENMILRIERRPNNNGLLLDVRIQTLHAYGVQQDEITPVLISSKLDEVTSVLLEVLFELNPLDGEFGQRIHVTSKPLCVTYDGKTISSILDVFKLPKSTREELSNMASTKVSNVKNMSAIGLQHVIEKRTKIDIKVDFSAPYVIIPYDGFYTGSENLLIVNFGHILINSVYDADSVKVQELFKGGMDTDKIMEKLLNRSYDKFQMVLKNVQVLIAQGDEKWEDCIFISNEITPMHLLEPLSLNILFENALVVDDPKLPLNRLSGELPAIKINISDARLMVLGALIKSLPLNEQEDYDALSISSSSINKLMKSEITEKLKISENVVDKNAVEMTRMELNFHLNEIKIKVSHQEMLSDPIQNIIELTLSNIRCEMTKQTYNLKVHTSLLSVDLSQYYKDRMIKIISTPTIKILENSEEVYKLFDIYFTQADRRGPDFRSKFNSCLSFVRFRFASVHLLFHQESCCILLKHIHEIQSQLTETFVEKKKVLNKSLSGSKVSVSSKPSAKKAKKHNDNYLMFKLDSKFHRLKVRFESDECPIAEISVAYVVTVIDGRESNTHIDCTLEKFNVLDLNKLTKYQKIVDVIDPNYLFNVKVTLFNNPPANHEDMEIIASMGGFRIIFVNWFIKNLTNFFNQFQTAQEAIKQASVKVAQNAKKNMTVLYEKATKIKLDVKIKAPEIIIPISSKNFSGLLIDLGKIVLTNMFENMILEKGTVCREKLLLKMDDLMVANIEMDKHLNILKETTVVEPVSFYFSILRNLSLWYKVIPTVEIDGRIETIELVVSDQDYQTIMKILTRNMMEGSVEPAHQSPKDQVQLIDSAATPSTKSRPASIMDTEELKKEAPHVTLKWNLVMQCFKISLYTSRHTLSQEHFVTNGLAEFALEGLALRGRIYSDNGIANTLVLVNCLLKDTRPGHEDKINVMLSRKAAEEETGPPRNMLDLTFQQKEDMFVDLRVYSFTFILSVEYILDLVKFFSDENASATTKKPPIVQKGVKEEEKKTSLTLSVKFEQPDIILVENMDSIDSRAIILHFESLIKLRLMKGSPSISATISDLQIYTCLFDPARRFSTRSSILQPLTITFAGSAPEGKGLHIEVIFSKLHISISLNALRLFNNIMSSISKSSAEKKLLEESELEPSDYSKMWNITKVNKDQFWFLKTDVEEALNYKFPQTVAKKVKNHELCFVTLPEIIVTIEAGVGNKTSPMILLKTRVQGKVNDWSSQMTVDVSLNLEISYFNSSLGLWEPFIEPIIESHNGETQIKPWELHLELSKNDLDEIALRDAENDTELSNLLAATVIDVTSSSNLEITITKSLLHLITKLGDLYSVAVSSSELKFSDEDAPIQVTNSTGLDVILMLESSNLCLANGTSPQQAELKSGAQVYLDIGTNLSNTSIGTELKSIDEFLFVKIPAFNDMILKLPLQRADRRFFCLKHNNISWGLLSSIIVDSGVTRLTLSSILNVHNAFSIPIDMYYMRESGNELEFISTIQPGSSYYVPMKAVYSPTSELFFSVNNFSVTSTPYAWRDLLLDVSITKNLVCIGKEKSDDLFVIRAIGEMSQVYYDVTDKYTIASTIYDIYLRPAVIIKNYLPIDIIVCTQDIENEVRVSPGDYIPVPRVEPGKSYVVIRIPDYLEKVWSCRYEVPQDPETFSVWSFNSYDSIKQVTLDLGMHTVNENGALTMSLYCPFWMVNKTGLILSYRKSKKTEKNESAGSPLKNSDENLNIIHHPPFLKGPILFSFNAKNFFGKKKVSVRVESGEWSEKFSIDVAGSSGVTVCKYKDKIYQLGVNNKITNNGLTKQITITPYYVIINNTSLTIECQELDRPADPWTSVDPNTCCPLWPYSEKEDKVIRLKIVETNEITVPFLITESHTTLLKLKILYGGINVDIQLMEGAVYVNMALYEKGMAPALIINNTTHTMKFWEKESVVIKELPCDQQMYFTWDNPSGQRILSWEGGYGKEHDDELQQDVVKEYDINTTETVYYVSFLDGMQRTLLFTSDDSVAENAQSSKNLEQVDLEMNVSIYGVGLSLVNNLKRQEIIYVAVASTGIIWEAAKINSKRFKQMSTKDNLSIEKVYQHQLLMPGSSTDEYVQIEDKFEINFATMSMKKPHKRNIRRRFQTGVWFQMRSSAHQVQLHAKINRLQIDNQLFDCTFPVLLAPITPPKSTAVVNAHKPFAELSIVQLLMKNSQIRQFKYFKVLIQEFHIKIDLGFINALMEMMDVSKTSPEEEKDKFLFDMKRVEDQLYEYASSHSLKEQKSFYDFLHFSPLKIHVSFSMSDSGSSTGTSNLPMFLSVLLQGIGVTLTDMHDVVFKLAFFQREFTFLTQRQLVKEAITHYLGQTVKQFYVLVLGLDVLGNPYGLVLGITKGVEDLFYEPFQGAIQGPGEFAEGLLLGVASLFGHTVGGAAGAVSRITGAMGKGIAALTFDKEYQRKRRGQLNKKPATVQEGFARGGKGLVMGFYDGVTGVVTKPVSGAKEQGVSGFFKGLGKGAVGLVTRPTAGVMDFASTSFDTVKRVTDFGHTETRRLRPPRFVQADCFVQPYMIDVATGNKYLCDLDKGKYYNTDIYSSHFTIIPKKEVLLMTDKRLAYIKHNDMFGSWQVEWAYTWIEIHKSPTLVPKGVQLFVESKKKNFFSGSDNGKIIVVPEEVARSIILNIDKHISTINEYNKNYAF